MNFYSNDLEIIPVTDKMKELRNESRERRKRRCVRKDGEEKEKHFVWTPKCPHHMFRVESAMEVSGSERKGLGGKRRAGNESKVAILYVSSFFYYQLKSYCKTYTTLGYKTNLYFLHLQNDFNSFHLNLLT